MSKKVWTAAARKAFALKMKRARAERGGLRKRRKNPASREWIVDAYASFHGAAMHPIVQVVTAGTHGKAVAAYKNKLAEQGYSVGKLISVREGSGARVRKRARNPTKAQVKEAAKKIAKRAASLAWAGTKRTARFTGRVAGAGAKAAAAEVKASICRTRAKNPKNKGFQVRIGSARKRKLVWTAMTRADAIHVAKVYAKAYPRKVVSVHAEK